MRNPLYHSRLQILHESIEHLFPIALGFCLEPQLNLCHMSRHAFFKPALQFATQPKTCLAECLSSGSIRKMLFRACLIPNGGRRRLRLRGQSGSSTVPRKVLQTVFQFGEALRQLTIMGLRLGLPPGDRLPEADTGTKNDSAPYRRHENFDQLSQEIYPSSNLGTISNSIINEIFILRVLLSTMTGVILPITRKQLELLGRLGWRLRTVSTAECCSADFSGWQNARVLRYRRLLIFA